MFKRIKLRKKTSGSSVTSEQKKYRKHIQRPFDAAFQCQFRVWGDGKSFRELQAFLRMCLNIILQRNKIEMVRAHNLESEGRALKKYL